MNIFVFQAMRKVGLIPTILLFFGFYALVAFLLFMGFYGFLFFMCFFKYLPVPALTPPGQSRHP
jgi:hypothetical protein